MEGLNMNNTIPTAQIEIAKTNLLRAAKELNFDVITPFAYTNDNINYKETFAFIPKYGSANGTIIGLNHSPQFSCDKDICIWAESHKCFYSFLNIECLLHYDISYYEDMLTDWGKMEDVL